ncbi:Translation_elongation factor [Hexamita inflata]|uniref:Translation_elongation factor n=1 Tax=Hexamita inflata TaxID=28002 RepID=A0ABP1H445_9EUKA
MSKFRLSKPKEEISLVELYNKRKNERKMMEEDLKCLNVNIQRKQDIAEQYGMITEIQEECKQLKSDRDRINKELEINEEQIQIIEQELSNQQNITNDQKLCVSNLEKSPNSNVKRNDQCQSTEIITTLNNDLQQLNLKISRKQEQIYQQNDDSDETKNKIELLQRDLHLLLNEREHIQNQINQNKGELQQIVKNQTTSIFGSSQVPKIPLKFANPKLIITMPAMQKKVIQIQTQKEMQIQRAQEEQREKERIIEEKQRNEKKIAGDQLQSLIQKCQSLVEQGDDLKNERKLMKEDLKFKKDLIHKNKETAEKYGLTIEIQKECEQLKKDRDKIKEELESKDKLIESLEQQLQELLLKIQNDQIQQDLVREQKQEQELRRQEYEIQQCIKKQDCIEEVYISNKKHPQKINLINSDQCTLTEIGQGLKSEYETMKKDIYRKKEQIRQLQHDDLDETKNQIELLERDLNIMANDLIDKEEQITEHKNKQNEQAQKILYNEYSNEYRSKLPIRIKQRVQERMHEVQCTDEQEQHVQQQIHQNNFKNQLIDLRNEYLDIETKLIKIKEQYKYFKKQKQQNEQNLEMQENQLNEKSVDQIERDYEQLKYDFENKHQQIQEFLTLKRDQIILEYKQLKDQLMQKREQIRQHEIKQDDLLRGCQKMKDYDQNQTECEEMLRDCDQILNDLNTKRKEIQNECNNLVNFKQQHFREIDRFLVQYDVKNMSSEENKIKDELKIQKQQNKIKANKLKILCKNEIKDEINQNLKYQKIQNEQDQRKKVAEQLTLQIQNENQIDNYIQYESTPCQVCKNEERVVLIKCKTCKGVFCILGQNIQDSDAFKHIRDQNHEIDLEFEVARRFKWEQEPQDQDKDKFEKEYQKEYLRQAQICQLQTDDITLQFKKMQEIETLATLLLQRINVTETKAFNDELQEKAAFYLDPEHIKQKKLQFLKIQSDKKTEKKIVNEEKKLVLKTNQTSHQVTKRNSFSVFANNQRKIEKQLYIKTLQMKIVEDTKNLDNIKPQMEKYDENYKDVQNIQAHITTIVNLVNNMKTQEQLLKNNKCIVSEYLENIQMNFSNLSEITKSTIFQVLLKLKSVQFKSLQNNTKLMQTEIDLILRIHNETAFYDEGIKQYGAMDQKLFNHLLPQKRNNNSYLQEQAKIIKIILKNYNNIKKNLNNIIENLNNMSKRQTVTISISKDVNKSEPTPEQPNQTDSSIKSTEETKQNNKKQNKQKETTEKSKVISVKIVKQPKSNLKLTNQKVEQQPKIARKSQSKIGNKFGNLENQNELISNDQEVIYNQEPNIKVEKYEELIKFLNEIKEKIPSINEYADIPEQIKSYVKYIEISENHLKLTKMFDFNSVQKIQVQKDNTEIQKRKDTLEKHDITKYLSDRHISVVFCGHVHHGKSTLSQQLLLESIKDTEARDIQRQRLFDLNKTMANVLNSLPEERRTGNTIEYAKRQFDTNGGRHVLLLDAPGHENYILSMIEAATQADIGVLLTSAKQGEYEDGTCGADREAEKRGQTLEHAQILYTCGVSTLIVVINKIDDVSCLEQPKKICQNIVDILLPQLVDIGFKKNNITFIPVSAKTNVNVCRQLKESEVGQNPQTQDIFQNIYNFKKEQFDGEQKLFAWYQGFSLMDAIDNVCMPFRDIGGFVRAMITSKKRQGQQYLVECKIEKGQFNVTDNDFVLMPINKEIQLESKQCDAAFHGDQCVVSVDKSTYQQMKIGDIICKKGQECKTSMQFFIAFCCVESTVICRGYKAMIHVGGIITEFEVVDVVGVLNDAGNLNSEIKIFGTGERAILKIRVLGRKNPICVSTFERDEFLGRVLVRHQRTTVGAGVVIEDWNNESLNVSETIDQPAYLQKIAGIQYQTNIQVVCTQKESEIKNQKKSKKQQGETDTTGMDSIKLWQIKKYIDAIQSMQKQDCVVTLYIRSSDSPESINKILNTKRSESLNVKSQATKAAIQSSIDKAIQYVTTNRIIPSNGLCIFAGSELIAFEPIQPIVYTGQSLFCEKDFNLGPLYSLMQPREKYIFVVFDGYMACIYQVYGASIAKLGEIEANIPKKGSQEQEDTKQGERNTRSELREQYINEIEKMVNDIFKDSTDITRIFLAFTSEFKDLIDHQLFQPKLAQLVHKPFVDIGYGLEHGLNYSIWQMRKMLINVTMVNEMKICKKFIKIVCDNNELKLYCKGLQRVISCIKQEIIECILIQDEYQCDYVVTNEISGYILPGTSIIIDDTGFQQQFDQNTQILQRQHIFDRFIEIRVTFSFISCQSAEGNQFCKGFEGIGAILTNPDLQNDE